ncbi:hypothetical protein Tco_1018305 [Tanacetum coccineum]|uniref:Tf2-1-like SH3-like domain-containing protein n=1 Tax=Tanacetum coccineum TaxID=301880 RepID=A0ABQ5FVE7_9ASTR
MSDLYDLKISVRSSVKLLLEIKGLLSMKANRERTVNVVSRHTDHHLAELKKNPNFNATYNLYGFAWAFKMSNPNVALILSPEEMSQSWFKASVEFIKGLDDQYGTFFQDDQGREKCIEQHNGMCGDTEDGTFVDGVVGKICPKMDQMSVDDGDSVLDSQSDDGDDVLDSQTKDVIEQAAMLPTVSSNSPQARNVAVSEFFAEFDALKKEVLLIKRRKDDEFDELTKRFSKLETFKTFVKFKKLLTNDLCSENESSDCNKKMYDGGVSIEEKPNFSSHHNDSSNHIGGVFSEAKASSSSAHPGNDEDVSYLDDNIEIDGQNANDGYSNSQHHLHLLIKALGTKIENPSIDAVIVQIRQRLQTARDRQRSYANVRRKPLEFQVGDHVMLKVSPCKGVIRFGKRGKLNPRYIGPFKILERIGPMAYKLDLAEELSNVHSTFYFSNLKKYLSDEYLVIPIKELRLDDKLNFVEERMKIMV